MTYRRNSPAEFAMLPSQAGPAAPAKLLVNVVFTTIEGTLKALRHAGSMARELDAVVRVLAPEPVPYPLPLTQPPVDPAFRLRQFRLLSCSGAVELQIELRLCRDIRQCLKDALPEGSLVVIGGKRGRLWPSREARLAQTLRGWDNEVMFVTED